MKTVKSRLYLERIKLQAQFCLSLGWLNISENKSLKTAWCRSSKYRKSSQFLTLILPTFGEHKKDKLYILKKVGLSTFKEILQKFAYNSTVIFFNIFLFCLKGYSETLKEDNPSQRNCPNQLSCPGLSHIEKECKENFTQEKIHNQQNSKEGLQYL